MNTDYKKEAKRQYLHYFRFWFIAVGILLVLTLCAGISYYIRLNAPRENTAAVEERVYDYAGILSDSEEEKLREYIAKKEKKYKADFVIMTFSQPVEGEEAREEYGYRFTDWEQNMQDIAADFWEENHYGFNKDVMGDGTILIDNRYEGQRGETLVTSGRVYEDFGDYHINVVLDKVDEYYDVNPYKAYVAYIDSVGYWLDEESGTYMGAEFFVFAAVVSAVVAACYAGIHLRKNKAKDTVAANAYVSGGQPQMRVRRDDFIRKSVVKHRIETNSGGSHGGGGGGGRGGSFSSSSGRSYGGGSRRH